MRTLIFGNSGSGKSVYARYLAQDCDAACLDLDTIVWEPGKVAVARPANAVQDDLHRFIRQHDMWVIEGCYGELIEAVLPYCTELVFMNPGCEVCLSNSQRRPWEPHKYASNSMQQQMFPALLAWVAAYYSREDAWSYDYHRRLFDSFTGAKREIAELIALGIEQEPERRTI